MFDAAPISDPEGSYRSAFFPLMRSPQGTISAAVPGMFTEAYNAIVRGLQGGSPEDQAYNGMLTGLNMLGGGMFSGTKPASALGANVWHGSPHKFEKFDASKIGTGEGAQAYGHGLYFAENPGVAKTYQFIDAKIDPDVVKYGGRGLESLYQAAQRAQDRAFRMPEGFAKETAIKKANAELGLWESMMTRNHPKQVILDAMDPAAGWPEQAAFAKSLDLNKFSGVDMNPGQLYKVDLPDTAIAKMLDWDKPLSQQPVAVSSKIRELLDFHQPSGSVVNADRSTGYAIWNQDLTGAQARELLELKLGKVQTDLALKDAGIPGIKYLDQGSREAGKGTYNYVVFPGEEQSLKILERK